ncbi:MAG: energy-coupling factor transporter ATPase [Clostridia bacterium]|jgi:energy-coupling factor transport system ATP-binding protein
MSILIEGLTHIYMQDSPFESTAIEDINLTIEDGEFIGLIGHTGSGKSTLIQHLNGLLKPTRGKIVVQGINLRDKGVSMKKIRQQVGLVFQYPEHQLFEETVYKDVAFGPTNLGLSPQEVEERVRESIQMVGLDYESIKDRSPFEISGGQRRRVAIAGVLAMQPSILILDEPTAGLDPRGRDEILSLIKDLHRKKGNAIILVSHSMEDISRMVDRIIVMNKGRIALIGKPAEIFAQAELLEEIGLGVPQTTKLVRALNKAGKNLPTDVFRLEDISKLIMERIRSKENA